MTRTHKTLLIALLALTAMLPACRSAGPQPFSVVVIPDSQCYAMQFPGIFYEHMDWVRDNIEKENVVFVTHVGDIVYGSHDNQWQVADKAMSKIDGLVPWGVAVGNHDYDNNATQDTTTFARYYGPKRFKGRPWYGGGTEDGQCSYQFFEGAGQRFMIMHLPYNPNGKSLAWAKDVLEAHPGIPAIVTTHSYLRPTRGGAANLSGHARVVKKRLIDKHSQIFMVICGHIHSDAPLYRTDKNDAGGTVVSLLADFQGGQWGGDGWLVILTFEPATNNIHVRTYSTRLKKFLPSEKGGDYTIPCPIPLTAAPSTAAAVEAASQSK